jgi:hypothetical protein
MSEIPNEITVPARMLERQREILVAHVAGAGRRQARRRVTVAAAAVVVLAALVAAPALGLGSRLAELFEGTPAPPPVQELFTASDEMQQRFIEAGLQDRYSRVVVEEARGVSSIETPDGPVRLWTAPTEDGRQCSLIELDVAPSGRVLGHARCDSLGAEGMSPSWLWAEVRSSVRVAHVRVYDEEIVRVDLHLVDGGVVQLPVVAGHAFGVVDRSARLDDFVGRNADGDEVARINRD